MITTRRRVRHLRTELRDLSRYNDHLLKQIDWLGAKVLLLAERRTAHSLRRQAAERDAAELRAAAREVLRLRSGRAWLTDDEHEAIQQLARAVEAHREGARSPEVTPR